MPNKDAIFTAKNITLGDQTLPTLPGGRYIQITFTDQGHGISKEHIGKIFDPYFSTKPQGTGLGLSLSYDIVKAHGGELTFESMDGKGSMFKIILSTNQLK